MKALLYLGRHHMEMCDQPDPKASNEDVLVSVEAAGICGSDMHGYHGHDPRRVPPLIMGHEICGRALSGSFSGQRVVINPQIACGQCERCEEGKPNLCMQRQSVGVDRAGGFADLMAVPERNLVPVAEGVDPVVAALAEPAATALHGVSLGLAVMGKPLSGVHALVIGGGAIGILSALWVRALGGHTISLTETNRMRQEMAEQEGFVPLDPGQPEMDRNTRDLVLDAVGSAASRRLALQVLRPGGVLVHLGLLNGDGGVDMRRVTLAEITVLGAFTYTPREVRDSIYALADGRLGKLRWIERRPLMEGASAFAALSRAEIAAAKIVLCPR